MSPSLFLCVDCGGTKTAAAICDSQGTTLGRGSGGPSNITYLTVEAFIFSIRTAILYALKEANVNAEDSLPPKDTSPFVAAWFGVSGADSPAAIAKVTPAISALLGIPAGPHLTIANDTHLLAAPIRMYAHIQHAVAVIAGTGSIAVSFKQEEGKIKELGRVGGWGWILGDEGGGFSVGRETLRQLLLEEDLASVRAQPPLPSKLRDRILQHFNLATVMELLGEVYCPDPKFGSSASEYGLRALPREKRISSLPPLVFDAGFNDDDWLANRVLHSCAKQLAEQVGLLLGDRETKDTVRSFRAENTVISFGGSLVREEKYRAIILDELTQHGHTFAYVHFIDDASATGAAALSAAYKD